MGSSVHLYSDAGFLLAKNKNLSADAKSNKKININHYTGNHWSKNKKSYFVFHIRK